MNDNALLEFPCDFPIKAMGPAGPETEAAILSIFRRHAPDLSEESIRNRESKGGKYISITVTIRATSREQLDTIYRELTACEQVLMVL